MPAPTDGAACIVRQVQTITSASAMPGKIAQAISVARRLADAGASSCAVRDGEETTDRSMAICATAQHATAIQKIASAREKGMARVENEIQTCKLHAAPARVSPYGATSRTI
jgi:hypothetical protein